MNLYISRQGQTIGPFSGEHVLQQLNANAFSLDDLACPVGGQQWMPLRQVLPSGPNQLTPPPLQTAGYPPKRPGRGWLWLILAGVFLVVALVAGVYLLLPGKLTGDVFREMEGPSGRSIYRPAGATVALYKHDGSLASLHSSRSKLREMKAYIEANQGHVDESKVRAMEAELSGRIRSTETTSTGNFTIEIDRTGLYDLVVWDHATVKGTTMTNSWVRVTGLKLWETSKHLEMDYDDATNLDD